MMNNGQAFKAVSRICLNNWHYIDEKILTLNESINFFTGHSGSGKSTVIDALQIVLYANTDGRGFFNKAAADDSDRSLIEYLRGMINIGENGQAAYKRNQNFSATIVLELTQTVTEERECVGVVFDVDVSTNEYARMFFWHRGGLLEGGYRNGARALTISELKERLRTGLEREDWFATSNNERFRRNLYDVYLGGLDMEKFPRLFKRAIPFRMNIRLEEFVKEYICMEQDIHMEEMQESVILYGRMKRRIEDARKELAELEAIEEQFLRFQKEAGIQEGLSDRLERLEVRRLSAEIETLQDKMTECKRDREQLEKGLQELMEESKSCQAQYDDCNRQLAGSGYSELEAKIEDICDNIELLLRSRRKWEETARRLKEWEEEESVSNQLLWDIEAFQKEKITAEALERLKKGLSMVREELERQHQETLAELRSTKKELAEAEQELSLLRLGKKAYPKELETAAARLRAGLYEKCGKEIPVRILADLLDIRDETWRNAIEGYLGANKLALIVEPAYVGEAMKLFEAMQKKQYLRVSLADTQKLADSAHQVKEGTLAGEVEAKEPYVRSFVDYLLGNVVKCRDIEELRGCRTGVTPDCLLYQNYQLRKMNPENYTVRAYIGEKSLKERQKKLQETVKKLTAREKEKEALSRQEQEALSREYLSAPVEEYLFLYRDMEELCRKEQQKKELQGSLEELNRGAVSSLREALSELSDRRLLLEKRADALKLSIHDRQTMLEAYGGEHISLNEQLKEKLAAQSREDQKEQAFAAYLEGEKSRDYHRLWLQTQEAIRRSAEREKQEQEKLFEVRLQYLKMHPERGFSAVAEDNEAYRKLSEELRFDRIEEYGKKAAAQAKVAAEHFKEDFVYKIRSAIKEAFVRRDELNRIIRNLNFGKDRYQFKITKNKGSYGAYYDMFMDESLEIDPSTLSDSVEHQMNLFSMEHENRYGVLMNDLIQIFIPPENAGAREQEEALANMERYSDYRTYLSFEMEQIVEGEERLVMNLSKMIKKNSGGEGQNPLYVALLASFAQAYKINTKVMRRPTIRLVVLDEAFSKMDAEKVASCIKLIRGLGFQAIISATNDKIQNYLENVDKTFVYANPNKKSISIQEFEKREFDQLAIQE